MTQPKIETEAKFLVPDAALFAALSQLPHLAEFELRPLGLKTVTDNYLDTTTHQFIQAGYACRLRQSARQRLITLKSLHGAQGQVHRRQEIEAEIGDAPVDRPQTWPESEAKTLAQQIAGESPLQTLFMLHQNRRQFHVLRDDRALIELSLDEVSLRDPAVIDYRELEAELLADGSETDLNRFITAILARWSLKVETLSKFERGLKVANL
jgi:inorganic triphosphatase YgiF